MAEKRAFRELPPHAKAGYPNTRVEVLADDEGDLNGFLVEADPAPPLDGWAVRMLLDPTGRPERFDLSPSKYTNAREELSKAMLRRVPLIEILNGADGPMGRSVGALEIAHSLTSGHPAWLVPNFPEVDVRPRRPTGRKGLPPIKWAEFAADYVANFKRGGTQQDLAERLNLSKSAVGERTRRARKLGYLPTTTRGQKGGHLTPKAVEVLAAHIQEKET